MKATNLNIFYQLGSAFGYLVAGNLHIGQEIGETALQLTFPREWLHGFLNETEEFGRYLRDSRAAAQEFLKQIFNIYNATRFQSGHALTSDECTGLLNAKEEFDKCFEREVRNLSVYTVTPKGTRDTAILIESPQDDLPDRLQKVLPDQVLYDLKQAGRCLAFDIPTACAFHTCRATEALILAYYELLAGQQWTLKRRDWSTYIQHLKNHQAPPKITQRLDEIRAMDRNSYIHPDINVSSECVSLSPAGLRRN